MMSNPNMTKPGSGGMAITQDAFLNRMKSLVKSPGSGDTLTGPLPLFFHAVDRWVYYAFGGLYRGVVILMAESRKSTKNWRKTGKREIILQKTEFYIKCPGNRKNDIFESRKNRKT